MSRIKRGDFLEKAALFRRQAEPFSLAEGYKLIILQVFSGLKRTASFDGFNLTESSSIRQCLLLLKRLNLPAKAVKYSDHVKVLFARCWEDLRLLSRLHDRIFGERRTPKDGSEYGFLLGYPRCCVERFYGGNHRGGRFGFPCEGRKRAQDGSLEVDYRLNRFSPICVVHHVPCGPDCRATIEWSDRILSLYKAYDPFLRRQAEAVLKKPVLLFGINHFLRFFDDIKKDRIFYDSVDAVNPKLFNEDEDLRVAGLLEQLGNGDQARFEKGSFSVFSGKKLLLKNTFSRQPYQLLRFV
ncbi:MAG: hypothetical protein WC732_01415 [Candidatus Omnitrophota bacterium]